MKEIFIGLGLITLVVISLILIMYIIGIISLLFNKYSLKYIFNQDIIFILDYSFTPFLYVLLFILIISLCYAIGKLILIT